MFIVNKYTKIYFQLVYKRKVKFPLKRSKQNYTELHHIIPKSISQDNSKNNLVRFTAREHYLAHLLLTKMFDRKDLIFKMIKAFNLMYKKADNQNRYINSRFYETNRLKIIQFQKNPQLSSEWRKKIREGMENSDYVRSEEHKKNLSKSLKGKGQTPEAIQKSKETKLKRYDGKLSDYHKQRISEGLKGNKLSEETKKKISESHIGKTASEETKKKLSDMRKGRILSEEHKKKIAESNSKPFSEERRKNVTEGIRKYWENKKNNTNIIDNNNELLW